MGLFILSKSTENLFLSRGLGAFVCFKRAETGGEFLLLDGQKVLSDLDPAVRQRMYERGVRFSNAELPFFDFLRSAGPLKEVSPRRKEPAV